MLNAYRDKELLISRTGYTGEIGFEIFCDKEKAPEILERQHGTRGKARRPRGPRYTET